MKKIRCTFVLPGRGERSGGARVTVEMARRLRRLGYLVRIAYRKAPPLSGPRLSWGWRRLGYRLHGLENFEWISQFDGPVEAFQRPEDLSCAPGEVLIGVGTMAVELVNAMAGDAIKIRYCHGFSDNRPELTRRVWSLPMHTIAVSGTLVPRLEELSSHEVLAVIPNGVNRDEYFVEDLERDGMGMVFSDHPIKAPELHLELLRRVRERWPALPEYIFGEPARPKEIPRESYHRLPPVDKARQLYNRSKIWLLASRSEGLPGPVLEAMACGCTVISSASLGSREIIRSGENGLIVPIGDLDAHVAAIERVLENDDFRRGLMVGGLRTAADYSWEQAVQKMDDFLRRITHDHFEPQRREKDLQYSC